MSNEDSLGEKVLFLTYHLLLKNNPRNSLLNLVEFDHNHKINLKPEFHTRYFKEGDSYVAGLVSYIHDMLKELTPEELPEFTLTRELALPNYAVGGSQELYGPIELN